MRQISNFHRCAIVLAVLAVSLLGASAFAAITDGFAGTVTGGDGGSAVTVTTAAQLKQYAESSTKYIITVSGTIDLGSGGKVKVKSSKTIKGANSSATIKGCLDLGSGGVQQVIIQNLNITNPSGDGITIWGAKHVLVTKCNIYDCGDGCCDITQLSDYVTVRWCKFYYNSSSAAHRFVSICGNVSGTNYNTTYHHNWFAQNCDQRMPSGSYTRCHLYNNYFSCTGNSYCSNFRTSAQGYAENNYYNKVKSPLYKEDTGKIYSSGNTFYQCTGIAGYTGKDSTFKPSNYYSYSLTATSSVPSQVMNGAGNK
ncbi:right-handed parallel beta-helix repeat-containing protein [Candidatus Sumerlaeota bacterium]|nr:right-handed parallel beta-helix repeat-containing protein [Candidatus Sumerlaeota bacterium]